MLRAVQCAHTLLEHTVTSLCSRPPPPLASSHAMCHQGCVLPLPSRGQHALRVQPTAQGWPLQSWWRRHAYGREEGGGPAEEQHPIVMASFPQPCLSFQPRLMAPRHMIAPSFSCSTAAQDELP